MTSFGWKRKHHSTASTSTLNEAFTNDEDAIEAESSIDWFTAAKRTRGGALEDGETKAERLKIDGTVLAENGRYWEAIRIWDQAIFLSPNNAKLYEMKCQALMELREDFDAVQSGEEAVRCDPLWSVARQTLGRAQMNLGEVEMALQSFCISLHLSPWLEDAREDIRWTQSVREKAKERHTTNERNSSQTPKETSSEMDMVLPRKFL